MQQRGRPVGQGLKKASSKVTLEHKIKLKKRLAKAYKQTEQTGPVETDFTPSLPQEPPRRPKAVHHQVHKPDPLQRARQNQARHAAALAEEQARKDAEINAVLQRKAEAQAARKEQHRKLTAKTRKGQPVLSNQIDNLLARIQKNSL